MIFVASLFSESGKNEIAQFRETIHNNNRFQNKGFFFAMKQYFNFKILFHCYGLVAEEFFILGSEHTSLKAKARSVTRVKQNIFQSSVNLFENREVVDCKEKFNTIFSEFLHREWCCSKNKNEIKKFLNTHSEVIVKPLDGISGQGIYKISLENLSETEIDKISDDLSGKNMILEEILQQKGFIHDINPDTVNTLRVNTLLTKEGPVFLAAMFRTGRKNELVDNVHAGGILWSLDRKGKILFGAQSNGNYFEQHPDSGIYLKGQTIPRFQEAINLCLKAQEQIPEVPQCGWDVVISDDYIALIEGNSGPAFWNVGDNGACWKEMKEYLYKNKIQIVK